MKVTIATLQATVEDKKLSLKQTKAEEKDLEKIEGIAEKLLDLNLQRLFLRKSMQSTRVVSAVSRRIH